MYQYVGILYLKISFLGGYIYAWFTHKENHNHF